MFRKWLSVDDTMRTESCCLGKGGRRKIISFQVERLLPLKDYPGIYILDQESPRESLVEGRWLDERYRACCMNPRDRKPLLQAQTKRLWSATSFSLITLIYANKKRHLVLKVASSKFTSMRFGFGIPFFPLQPFFPCFLTWPGGDPCFFLF